MVFKDGKAFSGFGLFKAVEGNIKDLDDLGKKEA